MAEELGGLSATIHVEVDKNDVEKARKDINSIFGNTNDKGFIDSMSEQMAKANEKQVKSVNQWKQSVETATTEVEEKHVKTSKKIADTSEKTAKKVSKNVKESADLTKKEIDAIDNALKKVAGAIGGYFAINALRGYLGQVVSIRSQFASTEKSFNVLLGSEEKGKKLFEDIKEFGATTPMNLGELASSAKMMLGFGIKVKDIMPNLRALGDVAMGDSGKFMSLSLAFSQASATGKLMGQDLLQMVNAGFNPLETMAKTTGKTIKQLKEEMSAGKISADMLRKAFMDATSEGGKYAGMLNEQSKTIAGARSNLEDSFDHMFNAIGEMIEDKYIDVIHFIESLVQNYKEVAKVLAELTVAYGAYRAAVLSLTAVEKAAATAARINAVAHAAQGVAVKKVTALNVLFAQSQKAFAAGANKITAMINPYTLLAAAIVGVSFAIYKVVTAETDLEKRQKKLNDLNEEYTKNIGREKMAVDQLFGKLQSLKKGTKEYNDVKSTIISKYGTYLNRLDAEKAKLNDIEGAYRGITSAIIEKNKYETLSKAQEEYFNSVNEIQGDIKSNYFNIFDKNRELAQKNGKTVVADRKVVELKERFGRVIDDIVKAAIDWDLPNQSQESIYDFVFRTIDKHNAEKFFDLGQTDFPHTTSDAAEQLIKVLFDESTHFGKKSESTFTKLRNAKNVWEQAQLIYKNTWEEISSTTDNNPETKPEQDINEDKKKYNERKKYAQEYAKIMIERNNAIADLETGLNKTEREKADERLKIEQQSLDKLAKLNGQTVKISKEDREQIAKEYGEIATMSVQKAREILPNVLSQIAVYDEGVTTSKKKTKNNAAQIKVNFAQAESDIAGLVMQQAVADNVIQRSYNGTDYNPLVEKYVNFVNAYIDLGRRAEQELQSISQQLNNPEISNEEKEKLQKEFEWTVNELSMAQKSLIQSYGDGASDIIDLVNTTLIDAEGKTQNALNAEILSLESQIKEFSKVDTKERAAELSELKAKLAATQKKLGDLKKTMFDKAKNPFWNEFIKNIDKLKSATDELFNQMLKFDELVDGTGQNTIKQLHAVFTSTISLIEGIKKFSDITAKGIIKSGDAVKSALNLIETASTILMIINVVMQAVQALDNLFSKKDVTAEFIDGMKQANLELKEFRRELQKIKEMDVYTSIFGNDQWGTLTADINNANKAYGRLIANVADFNNQRFEKNNGGKSHRFDSHSGSAGYKTEDEFAETFGFNPERMEKELEDFSKNIAKVQVKTGTKGWWLWKSDVTEDLSKVAPELFDKQGKINMDIVDKFVEQNSNAYQALSETQKTCLKEMSDNWKEYNEYLQTVKDTMSQWFGGLTNNIADMWVNAFKTGKYQLQDFKEIWDTTIEQMTTSMMTSQLITPILNNAEQKLEDIGYYQNPQEHLDEFFNVMSQAYKDIDGIKDDAMNMLQKWHDDYGLYQTDAEKDKIRSALDGGGIQSITQDTAEELNGRITQIQSHTYNISECSTAMREMQQQQLVLLQGIKGDTARLANIETEITKMRSAIVDINDRGVRMR